MCDQANHHNCEILDDLHLTISDLEMTIADLKKDIVDDLKRLAHWELLDYNDYDPIIEELQKKWEAK